MNKKINIKAMGILILSILLGGYITLFENQMLLGLIVIAGGLALTWGLFLKNNKKR